MFEIDTIKVDQKEEKILALIGLEFHSYSPWENNPKFDECVFQIHRIDRLKLSQLEKIKKLFKPLFDKLGINPEISYVYIHYCDYDGKFAVHDHDKPHAVYYLQMDTNAGRLYFPDFGDIVHPPLEDTFLIIPEFIKHGIGVHKSKVLRIAVTMQLENLE